MSSRPTSMPSMGRSEMKMASSRTMRTWMADEKLLPALSLMLPPVCIVRHWPNEAMTASTGSVLTVGVVVVVVVVSGVVAAFLNVPQAVIIAASIISMAILFFIIGLVLYFALQ